MQSYFIPHSESKLARWLVPAIFVSLLLHLGFAVWSMRFHFTHFGLPVAKEEPVKKFRVARVDLTPIPPAAQPTPTPPPVTPAPVQLPDETLPTAEIATLDTAPKPLPKIDTTQLEGAGAAIPSNDTTTTDMTVPAAPDFLDDPSALTKNLLNPDAGAAQKNPAVDFPDIPSSGQGNTQVEGFSNLDSLLSQTGPLSSKTAPIMIPSDLLYDYDSATLGPQAIESLNKLGTLIQRNPQAHFMIEGYTDSFGSAEYNQKLSTLRADSVKAWLVNEFGIPAERIRTKGFGSAKLIVPATEDIAAQQPNRRVEIVIQED